MTKANVPDALPFVDSLVTLEMSGALVREVLEQGFTLERCCRTRSCRGSDGAAPPASPGRGG
ncbi:hypothetical protein FBQ97_19175 [Acidobacteria bacterium ACD]|nr:MAG: hypothetical protein EDX89_18330 [Acidobacteriota bacterium]MDL1951911.1 hypothetical protein [Acidobacteria bacterium ACD]